MTGVTSRAQKSRRRSRSARSSSVSSSSDRERSVGADMRADATQGSTEGPPPMGRAAAPGTLQGVHSRGPRTALGPGVAGFAVAALALLVVLALAAPERRTAPRGGEFAAAGRRRAPGGG